MPKTATANRTAPTIGQIVPPPRSSAWAIAASVCSSQSSVLPASGWVRSLGQRARASRCSRPRRRPRRSGRPDRPGDDDRLAGAQLGARRSRGELLGAALDRQRDLADARRRGRNPQVDRPPWPRRRLDSRSEPSPWSLPEPAEGSKPAGPSPPPGDGPPPRRPGRTSRSPRPTGRRRRRRSRNDTIAWNVSFRASRAAPWPVAWSWAWDGSWHGPPGSPGSPWWPRPSPSPGRAW